MLCIIVELIRVDLSDVIPLALGGLEDDVVRRIEDHVVRGVDFGIVTL